MAIEGLCRSTNLCDYCAKRSAIENCEMLWLNALERGSPELWMIFTTREAHWDGERFMRAFQRIMEAVRARWPEAEYCALVEFTTGYGPRSGGKRRPHWNVFVYGVPKDEADELQKVAAAVWCRYVDAEAHQQKVYEVTDVRGLTRYVGLHFQKESQRPPRGWRGQRFRASRGFFVRPRMVMRKEARDALQVGLLVKRNGYDVETARLEVAARKDERWSLQRVNPSTVELPTPVKLANPARSPSEVERARADELYGRYVVALCELEPEGALCTDTTDTT